MTKEEKNLFTQLKAGEEEALNKIFDLYYTSLCLFCNTKVNDMEESRSIVQDVFLNLWIKRDEIHVTNSLKNYLFISVRNAAFDYLKKQQVRKKFLSNRNNVISDHVPFHDQMEEAELNALINHTIEKLPTKSRQAFLLSRLDGLSYRQIAETMGLSEKTVEMHIRNALKKVRGQLSSYFKSPFSKK